MFSSRRVNAATLVAVLCTCSIAKADIATEWDAIAIEATAVPPNSILQSRVLAITHAAMYDAARVINQKAALFLLPASNPTDRTHSRPPWPLPRILF